MNLQEDAEPCCLIKPVNAYPVWPLCTGLLNWEMGWFPGVLLVFWISVESETVRSTADSPVLGQFRFCFGKLTEGSEEEENYKEHGENLVLVRYVVLFFPSVSCPLYHLIQNIPDMFCLVGKTEWIKCCSGFLIPLVVLVLIQHLTYHSSMTVKISIHQQKILVKMLFPIPIKSDITNIWWQLLSF